MKKAILFSAAFVLLVSCNNNDDDYQRTVELLPVAKAEMPTEFVKDSITNIPVKFLRPTTCHIFDGFYYQKESNQRTVAVYLEQLEQSNCVTPLDTSIQVLNFKPRDTGMYHFKFWKGKDSSGTNLFDEYDVHVAH